MRTVNRFDGENEVLERPSSVLPCSSKTVNLRAGRKLAVHIDNIDMGWMPDLEHANLTRNAEQNQSEIRLWPVGLDAL
jgi:hypothetical protein